MFRYENEFLCVLISGRRGAPSTRTASPSSDLIMFFLSSTLRRVGQMRTLDGEALNFTIFFILFRRQMKLHKRYR